MQPGIGRADGTVPDTEAVFCHHDFSFLDDAVTSVCATFIDTITLKALLSYEPFGQSPPKLSSSAYVAETGTSSGRAMYAAANYISNGDIILVERPATIAPTPQNADLDLGMPYSDIPPILFKRLDPSTRALCNGLVNCKSASECGTEEGIIRTNCMAISIEDENDRGFEYAGLFPIASMCNHSCAPNAAIYWDTASFTLTLYAVRSIPLNEEITIAYTEIAATRQARRQSLFSFYGFNCACTWCLHTSTPLAMASSDHNRTEICGIQNSGNDVLQRWLTTPAIPPSTIRIRDEWALGAIEVEGLEAKGKFGHLFNLAVAAAALGERMEFLKWLNEVEREWKRDFSLGWARGEDRQLELILGWKHHPETFPNWGKRNPVFEQ